MKKRLLTGDRPTGKLHLGHYFGSLENRVKFQNQGYECFIIISDYQVTTDRLNTSEIENNIYNIVLDYLSSGINPQKSTIFVQSKIPELCELTTIFSMLTNFSRVGRNPTVKEEIRAEGLGKNISLGMFSYPVSQAADILLFKTNIVPVGEDQLPHIELTREIANKFNQIYKKIFPLPKPILSSATRLLGLDGQNKMSKSLGNTIMLSDSALEVNKKIKTAVTDSGKEIVFNTIKKPAISNLIQIYSLCSKIPIKKIEQKYKGVGYADFKTDLAKEINQFLTPIQRIRKKYEKKPMEIKKIIQKGTKKAQLEAQKTLQEVKKAMRINYSKIFE
jgi:tryptophanyl-tRNA synthetase